MFNVTNMLVKLFNLLVFLFFVLCVSCFIQLRWYKPDDIPPDLWKKDFSQQISDSPDNIFWFVQVISKRIMHNYIKLICKCKLFLTTRNYYKLYLGYLKIIKTNLLSSLKLKFLCVR